MLRRTSGSEHVQADGTIQVRYESGLTSENVQEEQERMGLAVETNKQTKKGGEELVRMSEDEPSRQV